MRESKIEHRYFKKNHEDFNAQEVSGPYCHVVQEFGVGWFSSSPATSSWLRRTLDAQILLFIMCAKQNFVQF